MFQNKELLFPFWISVNHHFHCISSPSSCYFEGFCCFFHCEMMCYQRFHIYSTCGNQFQCGSIAEKCFVIIIVKSVILKIYLYSLQYLKHPRISTSRAKAETKGICTNGLPIPTITATPPDLVT